MFNPKNLKNIAIQSKNGLNRVKVAQKINLNMKNTVNQSYGTSRVFEINHFKFYNDQTLMSENKRQMILTQQAVRRFSLFQQPNNKDEKSSKGDYEAGFDDLLN